MIIAQVSDTHIERSGPSARHLAQIVTCLNARQPRPDLVVVSGDTADGGRREEYDVLQSILERCEMPVYVVPGNHDRRPAMRASLPSAWYPGAMHEYLCYALETRPVRVIGIDSTDPKRPGGVLCARRLNWLDMTLADAPDQPTFLFMHHPPFRTGVNLADLLGFRGLRAFTAIVARRPNVRRIVAGHIHCERSALVGEAVATTSISSTPQRVPELFERRLAGFHHEPGGFTLHRWAESFSSETYVRTVGGTFALRSA